MNKNILIFDVWKELKELLQNYVDITYKAVTGDESLIQGYVHEK